MDDESYMRFALQMADKAVGQTSPNPAVGAVVVKDGEIVGFGSHLKAGENHAEVYALRMAGDKARGATIYVTLEPCSHYGKTNPCADLIIESGVQRAVIAAIDPNKQVFGTGIAKLRDAGLKVELGVLEKEARKLNAPFFHYTKTGKPYVTIKSAVSLDGKTATHTGESKWITGEESRLDVHAYRHKQDAILVGVNTVIADNPSLTTRLPNGDGKHPVRVILDSTLRTPENAKVVTDGKADTWIFVGKNARKEKRKQFLKNDRIRIIQLDEEKVILQKVLEYLGNNGMMSLFVEGGAEVNGAFLKEGLLNQLIMYIAPKLIGGLKAPTSFSGEGFSLLAEVPSLEIETMEKVGNDIKIIARHKGDEEHVYGYC